MSIIGQQEPIIHRQGCPDLMIDGRTLLLITKFMNKKYNFVIYAVIISDVTVASCYYLAYKKFKWFKMRINVIYAHIHDITLASCHM